MEKYRKELLYSILRSQFDKDLFISISNEIINRLDLSSYISSIDLYNDANDNLLGYYSLESKDINISENHRNPDVITMYYRGMFETLFHEIRHAKQSKLIDKYYDYYKKLPKEHIYTKEEEKELTMIYTFIISRDIAYKKEKLYKRKHDLFSDEHDANYYGFVDTDNFLKNIVPEFAIKSEKIRNFYLIELLLRGYKFKISGKLASPYEQFSIKKIDYQVRDNILKENKLSNYERLILGLPIDKELYVDLNKMKYTEQFPNDFEGYIKSC